MNLKRAALLSSAICVCICATQARASNVFYRISPAGSPLKIEAVLYAPAPEYPSQAINEHAEGSGVVEVTVQPDGIVASTKMVRSTGNRILDEAALSGFRRWRFRPHSVTPVRIPIQYRLHRATVHWGSRADLKTLGDADMVVRTAYR
jgi:TonB family protein